MSENKPRFRGSIIFPLILIVVGVIFLLRNIGVLTSDVWDTLISLWPLLLVAWGLDGILRREGITGPVILIGLGAVFLLNNLGYLSVNVWAAVFNLWPVLLIAIGLDIILRHRSAAWQLVGLVIALLVLVGSLALMGVQVNRGQEIAGEQISQPLQGASQAVVNINPGVGTLRMDASANPENLIEGTVVPLKGEKVTSDYSMDGITGIYSLQGTGGVFLNFGSAGNPEWGWDLALTPAVPLILSSSMGVGQSEFDLQGLTISELNVSQGIGQATIMLPETGRFVAKIEGAIGQTVILVPAGMAVRIMVDTALSNIDAPGNFTVSGDVYTSPGYATAQNRVELNVSQAIGNIRVEAER